MSPEPKKSQEPSVKYLKVVFNPTSDPNEPEDVVLSVNGEALQFKRGIEVIVPSPFLEAADHAVYNKVVQQEGQKRKKLIPVSRCTYSVKGESTKDEFLKTKKEGTEKAQEALNKRSSNED